VEDGEVVLGSDKSSSVLNTICNSIKNEFGQKYFIQAVSHLNAHQLCQSIADQVPGNKNSIPGLPRTKILAHQVWAIWFIGRRWVSDSDMPGALLANEMDLDNTFTSLAVAMIYELVTEMVVMGLLLSMLLGNTLKEWVNMVHYDYPGIISEEQKWYLLQRLNWVLCHRLEIQTTPHHGCPVHTLTFEAIRVVIMPGGAETSNNVIDMKTYGTNFNLVYWSQIENTNLKQDILNTSIGKPGNRWNIHLASCDTFTSRVKPPYNRQLSYCASSFGIFDKSNQYRTRNSVCWHIVMKARIGFILQVIATLLFYSLSEMGFQTTWLFSGVPEDAENDTVMESMMQRHCLDCEVIDACNLDWIPRCSTGCAALADTDCKVSDYNVVVGGDNSQCKFTHFDTAEKWTPHESPVDGGRVCKTEDPCEKIHFMGCFWIMGGL